MTASESLGYGLLGFGPALSMFALTIARHPSRVVVLLLSSFSWILSLLLSSLAWFVLSPLGSSLDVIVAIAVLFQEGARLATLQALRKVDHSLKLAALAGDAQLARSRAALAYASGLGFGVASGACSLLNPLADIADAGVPPGVAGTAKSIPESFILASALTTGILTVLHTLWSVVAFQALCLQSTLLIAFPLVAHMFASGATLMYSRGHFGIPLAAIVGLLFLTAAVAFVVTGGQAGRAWSRLGHAQGSSSPEGSEHETA
ncbi:gamma-secretase subunit Aph-1-like [Rhipicephalus microplus]|uniref:gamma-secretase subunit Aph-1-like n=1 Tax=Rhipicephalus microplus TaxID=6941 RepID=UPI003F6CA173